MLTNQNLPDETDVSEISKRLLKEKKSNEKLNAKAFILVLVLMVTSSGVFAQTRIRFARGRTSASVSGRIGGGSSGGKSRYLGCYKDTNKPFDSDGFLERSQNNTPQRCMETYRAKGFKFSGVQYGESCLCGDSYGRYGKADNCNMKCIGDSGQICGGLYANSVYGTGVGGGN